MKRNNISKLREYLYNRSRWCTAAELASYLHTTSRTIHNYVREINRQKKDLIISSQEGYMYNPGEAETSVNNTSDREYDTPLKRMAYILKQMLYYGEAVYHEIAEDLFVSESTIDSDMIRIRNEISPFEVRLRKKGDAFTVTGNEMKMRQLIYHCILLNNPARTLSKHDVMADFPDMEIDVICSIIEETARKYSIQINRINYYYFITVICIQLSRIQKGLNIKTIPLSRTSIELFSEYHAAEELTGIFRSRFTTTFTTEEKYYLALILISFCVPDNASNPTEIAEMPDLHSFATNNLRTISERMNIDLCTPEIVNKTEHALQRMIIRKKSGIFFPVPFSYSIRKNQPLLVNYVIWMGEAFSKKYGLSVIDEDISLLTLTLAPYNPARTKTEKINTLLIIPEYNNYSDVLTEKIRSHYDDLLSIEQIQTGVIGNENERKDRLIISVFPLDKTANTVVISPFFTNDDQYILNNAIHRIQTDRYIDRLLDLFRSYLKPHHLKFNIPVTSRHRILNSISEVFYRENDITEDDIQQLLRRERISPTSFNDLMSMPHITSRSVKQKNLYVILNKEPFNWGNSIINMLICAIWPREDLEEMQEFYYISSQIFSSPLVIKKLLQAVDTVSLISLLESLKSYQQH